MIYALAGVFVKLVWVVQITSLTDFQTKGAWILLKLFCRNHFVKKIGNACHGKAKSMLTGNINHKASKIS